MGAGYVADDLSEVSPYSYTYAVADDYSGAAFQQAENNDGAGVVDGEYSVNLPDGRIQHVKYHANDYDGYVADVTYEGEPHYAAAAPVAHAVHAPVCPCRPCPSPPCCPCPSSCPCCPCPSCCSCPSSCSSWLN